MMDLFELNDMDREGTFTIVMRHRTGGRVHTHRLYNEKDEPITFTSYKEAREEAGRRGQYSQDPTITYKVEEVG